MKKILFISLFLLAGISSGQMIPAINSSNTDLSAFRTNIGLGNVENTALSTWAGSSNITTVGAGAITNIMLAGSIAYSKLSLTAAILNADLAGSIDLTTKVTGVLPAANGGESRGTTAMSATTGTITVPMTSAFHTVTPTGNMTWNATAGTVIGQFVGITITTSGTTSFTMTPSTNFKSATLATGTVTAKQWKLLYRWDGTFWQEFSRTAAQ